MRAWSYEIYLLVSNLGISRVSPASELDYIELNTRG